MMKGQLRVSVGRDGSRDCEVFIQFQRGGYVGQGSAWFNMAEIEVFAKNLAKYPLPAQVELCGGFWHSTERRIEHEHLFLAVYPIDSIGHLGFKIRGTTPIHGEDRPQQKHSAEIELRTEYEPLRRFSMSLLDVLHGVRDEAVLNEVGSE